MIQIRKTIVVLCIVLVAGAFPTFGDLLPINGPTQLSVSADLSSWGGIDSAVDTVSGDNKGWNINGEYDANHFLRVEMTTAVIGSTFNKVQIVSGHDTAYFTIQDFGLYSARTPTRRRLGQLTRPMLPVAAIS